MKLTVFGATGAIGGYVVRQALEAGDSVTAVVRRSSVFELSHPRLEVVRVAGLTEPRALEPALDGADAAVSGVGPRARKDVTVASTATRGILGALEACGVKRFVAVSAAPVAPPAERDSFLNKRIVFPLIGRMLRDIYADLATMEREIMASDLDWTIVRPPRLVDKPPSGVYRTAIGANVPRGVTISKADVAHLIRAVLVSPAMSRQAVGVAY
jgi:uncharacterized protein YbjT (DUF2867 family)